MHKRASAPELIADGIVHCIALIAAIVATTLLTLHVSTDQSSLIIAAVCIYGAVMILSFLVSGIYNLWPFEKLREPLRRLDHAAIYLKIAGTYTPLVVLLGSLFGYLVLAGVWTVALCAAVGKLFIARWPNGLNTGLTLSLGWAALILLWPLAGTLPGPSLGLIFLGGVLYSVGTVFYLWTNLKYHTPIWHGFVLSASAMIFAAIALALA